MNQRALEPSALAMLKWMHGPQATFEHFAPGIKAGLLEQAEECITAYEAHLKAEGFVVVRAADLQYVAEHSGERTIRKKARAMLSAATTGETSPPKVEG
jgi:hypothetical protein